MLASWGAAAGEPAAGLAGPVAAAGPGSGRTAGPGRILGLEALRIPGGGTEAEPGLEEGSCSGTRLGGRHTRRPVHSLGCAGRNATGSLRRSRSLGRRPCHLGCTRRATEPAAPSGAAGGRLVGSSVDADRATIEFDVIHGLDGGVGFAVLGEAHEAKAATAASIAILNHDGLLDLAKLLKLGSESHIIRVPGEAANEDLGHDEK